MYREQYVICRLISPKIVYTVTIKTAFWSAWHSEICSNSSVSLVWELWDKENIVQLVLMVQLELFVYTLRWKRNPQKGTINICIVYLNV